MVRNPNVAVVVLDTLRKDYFDKHFDWMPGTHYSNAWSPAGWTVPVHASMFTGLYPSEHGAHGQSPVFSPETPPLPEVLSNKGYRTSAYSTNPYVSGAFGFDRGFDVFEGNVRIKVQDGDILDWQAFIDDVDGDGPSRYLKALRQCISGECNTVESLKYGALLKLDDFGLYETDSGAKGALEWVKSQEFSDSEFLFMNLMEAHAPYSPPDEYRTNPDFSPHGDVGLTDLIRQPDGDNLRQAYDDSVRYLSNTYESIFDELSNSFNYIITIADHGELLGEHNLWGHEFGVAPELTHIPLVVWDGTSNTTECDDLVSAVDVYSTVSHVTGSDTKSTGISLASEDDYRETTLAEYHGLPDHRVTSLQKLDFPVEDYNDILRGIGIESYYGYQSREGWVDVGEPPVNNPESLLSEEIENLNERKSETDSHEMSDVTKRQLEDLGYM